MDGVMIIAGIILFTVGAILLLGAITLIMDGIIQIMAGIIMAIGTTTPLIPATQAEGAHLIPILKA